MMHTNPNLKTSAASTADESSTPVQTPTWASLVEELLARAAAVSADNGVDLDDWMKAAWSAYVEARPGLRAHLEEMHLLAQLDELRKGGRMGEA
jgi:hypothetical protein